MLALLPCHTVADTKAEHRAVDNDNYRSLGLKLYPAGRWKSD